MSARTSSKSYDSHEAVTRMMAALLPVHGAPTPDRLVDAACVAAGRGLDASFSFALFEGEDGGLAYQPPASDVLRREHARAIDAIGTLAFRTPIDARRSSHLSDALDGGTLVAAPVTEVFGPLVGAERAASAARELAVEAAYLAPLATAAERIGVLIVLGPRTIDGEQVRLLADHIACAIVNLRNTEILQEQEDIAAARAVFDARKLESELQRELSRATRYHRQVSICVIEGTNLRLLRERFGRALADGLLQQLGDALSQRARDVDVLGAYKESGYTMILTEAGGEGAEAAAGRLLRTALEAASGDDEQVPGLELHMVAGWATCPEDGTTSEALFAAALRRMYDAASRAA